MLAGLIQGWAYERPPLNTKPLAMTGAPDLDAEREKDAVLLRRFAKGDAAAARLLTARLTPQVYRHALRVLGNVAQAEDVTQEAMLRLWQIAPKWDAGRAKATTWLYRVTANLCLDRLRRRADVALDGIEEPEDQTQSVERRLQDTARHDALQQALNDLPERQRHAVILRHLEGLSNPQIAEILDIGVEAVESLTARGKRALGVALKSQKSALGYQDDR